MEVGEYINDLTLDSQRYCGLEKKPNKSVSRQRQDFLSFRGQNWENSHQNDLAFRVCTMYTDGNTEICDKAKNKTIKQVYDDVTREPTIYDKQCLRVPKYDHLLRNGYHTNEAATGAYITDDRWVYSNDKVMNGGQFDTNLFAHDPTANGFPTYSS